MFKLDDVDIPFQYELTPGAPVQYMTHQARMVQVLSGLGLGLMDIASSLNLPPAEVKEKYTKELTNGAALANISVAHTAYKLAVSGECPDMTRFWLRSRAGWTEKTIVEHTGKDGNPIEIEISAKEKLARLINPED